jgi:hypothetical protein
MTTTTRTLLLLPPLTLLLACGSESGRIPSELSASDRPTFGPSASSFANSEWSEPVNVGAPINSSDREDNASLSPDELSLYYTSDRADGLGVRDIWVSRRACVGCPWETPVNLGSPINGPGTETGPRLSIDGHLFFFQSDRPGGQGSNDIYMSRRDNPNDDFSWGHPVHLSTDVNTALADNAADYLQSAEDGSANLYFNRGSGNAQDLYYAAVTRDGETRGPAVLVPGLNDPTAQDQHASLRKDGREIFFASNRVGGLGGLDLWTSTRRSVHESWSAPVNLGARLNTTVNDQHPSLSSDGRTLLFSSDRPGGLGSSDLWMSTRTPSGN